MDRKFTCKARLVEGAHNTAPPLSVTYSSFVTRESVRLELLISGMNNPDIFACDIGNAYLNDTCQGVIWTKAGSEFGSEKVYVFLIVRDIHGLKLPEESWRDKLIETLNSIDYRSTESDPNVWIKRATPDNGNAY